VEIAQNLAADKDRLRRLRGNLREDFLKSPLGDGPRYQCNVEAMYQVCVSVCVYIYVRIYIYTYIYMCVLFWAFVFV